MANKALLKNFEHKAVEHRHGCRLEEVVAEHVLVKYVWLLSKNLNFLHESVIDNYDTKCSRVNFRLCDCEFFDNFLFFFDLEKCLNIIEYQIEEKVIKWSKLF